MMRIVEEDSTVRHFLSLPKAAAAASSASAHKPSAAHNNVTLDYSDCSCCHAKTTTAIWGILEAGVCVASYIPIYLIAQHWRMSSLSPLSPPHQQLVYLASMLTTTLQVFVIGVMEYAIATERWVLMLPYLVQQLCRLGAFTAALVYAETAASAPEIEGYRGARRGVGVALLGVTALALLNAARCTAFLRRRAAERRAQDDAFPKPSPHNSNVYNV